MVGTPTGVNGKILLVGDNYDEQVASFLIDRQFAYTSKEKVSCEDIKTATLKGVGAVFICNVPKGDKRDGIVKFLQEKGLDVYLTNTDVKYIEDAEPIKVE